MLSLLMAVIIDLFEKLFGKKERPANEIELRSFPEYGTVYTVIEFLESVQAGGITDDDGIGYLATDKNMSDVPFNFFEPEIPFWATKII